MTISTTTRSSTSSIPSPSIAPTIRHDLRTYTQFGMSRIYPPFSAPLSVPSRYFDGRALSQIRLPRMNDQSIHRGLNFIDLPTSVAPSNASMVITSDKCGVHLDPRVPWPWSKPRKGAAHSSQEAPSISLLPSCTTLAVVEDPGGRQRLVAAGSWPDAGEGAGHRGDDDDEEGHAPDWMLVSEVLPEGTIFHPDGQVDAESVLAGSAVQSPTAQ